MKPITRRLRIRGRWWKFILGRPPENGCDGICYPTEHTIYVRPSCPDPIGTAIHEVLHAAVPDLDEACVSETEAALCEALKAMGLHF